MGPGSDTADIATTIGYLSTSAEFRHEYGALVSSSYVYTITTNSSNDMEYYPGTRTISYDPHSGLEFSNGDIQSAAIGFAHEVNHAYRHDQDPKQFWADNKAKVTIGPKGEIVVHLSTPNEQKATAFEDKIAADKGERGRGGYGERVKPRRTSSPTEHRDTQKPTGGVRICYGSTDDCRR